MLDVLDALDAFRFAVLVPAGSLPELRAIARRQGFPDLGAVHTAILETNGVVTMFHADEPCHYHPEHPAVPLGLRIGKRRRAADM